MMVFYTTNLTGHWMDATVVAVAASEADAREAIKVEMAKAGLVQDHEFTVTALDTSKPAVVILDDGDY